MILRVVGRVRTRAAHVKRRELATAKSLCMRIGVGVTMYCLQVIRDRINWKRETTGSIKSFNRRWKARLVTAGKGDVQSRRTGWLIHLTYSRCADITRWEHPLIGDRGSFRQRGFTDALATNGIRGDNRSVTSRTRPEVYIRAR